MFAGYLRLLRTRTLQTQIATTAFIFPLGDAISQHLINNTKLIDHNYDRTLRSITYGTLFWAPLSYKWNKFLNTITYPSSKLKTVACRVGIDISIFTSFATCYFFTIIGVLEGRNWNSIIDRIHTNYSTVACTNMAIFGPAQIINMSLIPVYGRPIFLNFVSLGYNCFLATINNSKTVNQTTTNTTSATATKMSDTETSPSGFMRHTSQNI
ncbi:hypothetical protein Pst134EA_003348 [Puccinia striiformis f. sp. tritici]|uniref:MpV17 mitochondrial inner membrane protein n=1 Tax=Puccinia striiformis f. sp. tritici PST-78 TaxID=1165861 RepID=A0A0L0VQU4_9BASI|nr:hypothetical protein Pst134EA_003348 [Puccinia striiformis f. sp. tritici]KAH9472741.1 hypothetical protein Pst134EA_003348 [Puccinia striiformis f. sp. tritici]KNF01653.1 hypothetical protein PSTG_05085 [Puccinia striiformis f. sp. tritici PST-78]